MSKTVYVDNTNATDPSGGKRHIVNTADADKLPPEELDHRAKRRKTTGTARKPTGTARKTSRTGRKSAGTARKPAGTKKAARSRR